MTPDSHDIGTPARAAVQPDTRAHTDPAAALIYTVLAMAGWRGLPLMLIMPRSPAFGGVAG